jgi:uncharacterized protein
MQIIRLAVLMLLLVASPASAQNYPAYTETYVNDFADLLDPGQEARIRGWLQALREDRGIEFTVVTIKSMADYGHTGAIEPFATGLFNTWGVGDATRNDGVMLLVSLDDRRLRIEVGRGYGLTKNAPMKEIIDNAIRPRFRRDDYAGGIERGVRLVIEDLTGASPQAAPQEFISRTTSWLQRLLDSLGGWIYAILAPLLLLPANIYRRYRRNKPRICPIDSTEMQRLDEVWDDNHLQQGQITEERLKSVDYDVWKCPKCAHVTIEAYRAWLSQYGACRACGFRTVQGTTTILREATTSSEGRKRIDYHCHNCQDDYSVTKTIPKKSESSSSSGSSFGGGSSSGGGASGSW